MLDNLWNILSDNTAIVISVLSLIASIVALSISRQSLKVAKKRLRVAEGRLELEERRLNFGKDFIKGQMITDGSLRLDFLQVAFKEPEENEHRLIACLMHQSAVEALITIENLSSNDALIQNLYVIPILRPGMSKQSRFEQSWFARYVLRIKPHDSEVIISLRDHEILSILGPVGKEWRELASSEFDYFRDRFLWHACVYDASTDQQISFTEQTAIPHDGLKRIWKLELSIDSEFYQALLKHGFYLSGIKLWMITDLGNLEANYDYDTPGKLL